ncbi:hypothetical protein H7Q97_13150 [Ochrobactrum sp. CM-21-5]|nr:hypothetical protein [Ochrobactrum sp. CM-21-5]MBC2886339.1 hypothetical protein [Ochrobactrum sp. CM-21-5]
MPVLFFGEVVTARERNGQQKDSVPDFLSMQTPSMGSIFLMQAGNMNLLEPAWNFLSIAVIRPIRIYVRLASGPTRIFMA